MVFALLITGLCLRLGLIAYGEWQDRVMNLKYTDIDYSIFSNASVYVLEGGSPFDQDTYRYTPILAYLMVPNVFLHESYGKVLFSLLDIVAGFLLYKILHMRNVPAKICTLCSACWVLNPLPLVVSSRGNAESVLACVVLSTLYFTLKREHILAALAIAFAVHFKTYPIIYAPSLYLLLNEQYGNGVQGAETKLSYVKQLLYPSDIAWLFAVIGAVINIGLIAFFYQLYGEKFLEETIYYHITRKDTQHNFSIYFYPLRIAEGFDSLFSLILGLSAFLPQFGAVISFSYQYYRDLPFCWFMITMTFVTFNKVCTSQYFLWYLCLLPLIMPSIDITVSKAVTMFTLWLAAQGVWFYPAYLYEYHDYEILMLVWMASLGFFWVNIWIMWSLVGSYKYSPVFKSFTELADQKLCWGNPLQTKRKD